MNLDQFLRILRGGAPRSWSRPSGTFAPNVRNDGYDQHRINAANAKRQRRRDRNIRNAYSMVVHR